MFPLLGDAFKAFQTLKSHIDNSLVTAIDEDLLVIIETDASNIAIEAILYQGEASSFLFPYS